MIDQNIFHPVNILLYERTVIAHLVSDLLFLDFAYFAVDNHINRIAGHQVQQAEYQN